MKCKHFSPALKRLFVKCNINRLNIKCLSAQTPTLSAENYARYMLDSMLESLPLTRSLKVATFEIT